MLVHCDNAAVVAVINSRYSREGQLMQMLRCLFFIEAQHQFRLSAVHIAGVRNDLADSLSRNDAKAFLTKREACDTKPSMIPPSILQWLLHPELDWTCPSWMQLFSSSVTKA